MEKSESRQRNLYVWGENPLFNQMLASEIKRISNDGVFIINLVTLPLRESQQEGDVHFFFCDCWGGDVHRICRTLSQQEKQISGENHFVLINVNNKDEICSEISRLNVVGIFYVNDNLKILQKGIQAVLAGEMWLSRELMSQILLCTRGGKSLEGDVGNLLTKREKEILLHIASGLSNSDLADLLFISKNTVKTHVSNIYAKIEVPNRVQAILWAAKFLEV